jgi:hypothetical protein
MLLRWIAAMKRRGLAVSVRAARTIFGTPTGQTLALKSEEVVGTHSCFTDEGYGALRLVRAGRLLTHALWRDCNRLT